jgi:hypothetical protein
MVKADLDRLAGNIKKFDGEVASMEEPLPPGDGQGLMVCIAIGRRDGLSKQAARVAARKWREVIHQYPKIACIRILMIGYDDDPREIWEIVDSARYVRRWARLAGIDDVETAWNSPLGAEGAAFLAACGCFGEVWPPTTTVM